jgi:small subunit ribosomal protein S3Ae
MAAIIESKAEAKQAPKAAQQRKTVDKWKKKKWFNVSASRAFNKAPIGETPAEKPKNLINRTMKVTLDNLTGNKMKREFTITFKINDIQGQNASTKISAFEINKGSLGRTIRRRNSKIGFIYQIPVVGGNVRFTIVVITERPSVKQQDITIRQIIKQSLDELAGKDFEDIVHDMLAGSYTTNVFKKASKFCQIKKVIPAKALFFETK